MSRIIDARARRPLAAIAIALILMSANVSAEITHGKYSLSVLDQDGRESHFTLRMGLSGFDPSSPPQMGLKGTVPGLEVLSLSLRPSRQKAESAVLECECVYSGTGDFTFPSLWLEIGGKRVTLRGERITRVKLGLPAPSAIVAPSPKHPPTAKAAHPGTLVTSPRPGTKPTIKPTAKPAVKPTAFATPPRKTAPSASVKPAAEDTGVQGPSSSGDRLLIPVGTKFYAVPDARSVNFEISAEEVEVKVQKRLCLGKQTNWLFVKLPNGEKAWIIENKMKNGR
jgi:hypothetical protein